MPWLQLIAHTRAELAEQAADRLQELGAVSVTFTDEADHPIYEPDPGTTPLWPVTRVVGLFDADADGPALVAALEQVMPADSLHQLELVALADQQWETAWQDHFRPMAFGERLWVCPDDQQIPEQNKVIIRLAPGLAFGTGTHPTTALCLNWLDRHLRSGDRVLDFGCGSGILALGAALLGAREVVATDIDPQALTATRDNARANGVDTVISTHLPGDLPRGDYDVLLANILANPLLELAPDLAERVRPGGVIVLSGFLEQQLAELRDCYRHWFALQAPMLREGWACLYGIRN